MRLTRANVSRYVLPAGKAEALLFDDDLPGFGLRVRAGGKRTWVAQYRLGTKQRRVTLGTSETVDPEEARRRAREALAKVSLGGDPQTEKRAARGHAAATLGSVVPRYLAFAQPRQTVDYHADVRRYLRQHWGALSEVPLVALDRITIATRLGEIARTNGPHAANRARATLSALFAWAIGEGAASANPVSGSHKAIEDVRRDRVLSDSELREVWQHAGQGAFGSIVRLLILTGQRRDEVGGMLWRELDGHTWLIGGGRTKNGHPHEVPLSPAASAILTGVPRRNDRDLVFGSGAGPFAGWSKSKENLDKRIEAGRTEASVRQPAIPPWRLHDVRRTVATRMADLGVLPHVIESILNHVSGHKAGVAGIYNRSNYTTEKRAGLTLWADRVAEITR